MSLGVRVDASDPTPAYEQLRRQLAGLIVAGELAPDARLPTVRQLALDLGLAPGTVMRSYRELELAGLIASRRGRGTVVMGPPDPPLARLPAHTQRFVDDAVRLGASADQIRAAVDAALRGR